MYFFDYQHLHPGYHSIFKHGPSKRLVLPSFIIRAVLTCISFSIMVQYYTYYDRLHQVGPIQYANLYNKNWLPFLVLVSLT